MEDHRGSTVATVAGREADLAASYDALLFLQPDLAYRTHQALATANRTHGIMMRGRPLCSVLRPRFLDVRHCAALSRASSLLATVFERAGARILQSDALLDQVGASDEERAIWAVDPGYPGFTLTSRLDSFMTEDTLSFIEYNAESPAGIGYSDVLAAIYRQLPSLQQWEQSRRLRSFDACRHLLDTLLWAYQIWGGRGTPTVAVVDWEDVLTKRDFEIAADYFRAHGIPTIISDPRHLDYHHGKVWYGDQVITMVYRRVLLHELLAKATEAQPLLQAYRDGAICMVNSPRSKLLHKKSVLALLSSSRLDLDLSDEERRALDTYLPWTRLLQPGETTYQGREVDLPSFVVAHRDQLVLKPYDAYGGQGVIVGWDTPPDRWEQAVETELGRGYVVQERVAVPQLDFPIWEADRVETVPLLVDTDPLLFRGTMGGIVTRTSGSAVLNVSAGQGSATATFLVGEEEETCRANSL